MRRIMTALPTFVVLIGMLSLGGIPVAATATPTATEDIGPKVLRMNWDPSMPDTLDPQQSDQGQWSMSGGLDYEGLTRIDEELQPVPGAAASWDFSADGTTLTFHLRAGLVYSDGVPVRAEDFRYAAERICSPELDSRSVDQLADVIGCMDLFHSGGDAAAAARAKAAFGVRALDAQTLEYRFTRP